MRPSPVNAIEGFRSNSAPPSSHSSALMALLSEGCETPQRRAAQVKLSRHGEFRVAGSVFKESRARTRQQWENALVLAERRAALGPRPFIATYDF
jgi:hypothetical protein